MLGEIIEQAALADLHNAADRDIRAQLGLSLKRSGAHILSMATRLPRSALAVNRGIMVLAPGQGDDAAAAGDPEEVSRLVSNYHDADVRNFLLQIAPANDPGMHANGGLLSAEGRSGVDEMLERSGLVRTRDWVKFERGVTEPFGSAHSDLRVEKIGIAHGQAFGRIVADAFDLGPEAAQWLSRLPGRLGWHIYMSFDGDVAVGTGGFFVRGTACWLDWGATDPKYRGRGSQSVLLQRGVQDAIALGARRLFTSAGGASKDDPAYRNILRTGFKESYLRPNFAPAA